MSQIDQHRFDITPIPCEAQKNTTWHRLFSFRFSAAIMACLSGCASAPENTSTYEARAAKPLPSDLEVYSDREELLLLQESELRRIRMDLARLPEGDVNAEILESFERRKSEIENKMSIMYYVHCKISPEAFSQLPESIPDEQVFATLRDEEEPGRFNTILSDFIFRFENEQRFLRVSLHGIIDDRTISPQSVSEYREQAQERFQERESILQSLYKRLVTDGFR